MIAVKAVRLTLLLKISVIVGQPIIWAVIQSIAEVIIEAVVEAIIEAVIKAIVEAVVNPAEPIGKIRQANLPFSSDFRTAKK